MPTLTEDAHRVRIGGHSCEGKRSAALAPHRIRTVPSNPEVVLANMHGSFTGVSATIANLAEHHARRFDTAIFGHELPTHVRLLGWWEMARMLWQRPAGRHVRIWHARRNPEMWLGLFLKYVLRSPLKLVFTTVALRIIPSSTTADLRHGCDHRDDAAGGFLCPALRCDRSARD